MSCFGVTVRDEIVADRQGQTEERTEREELEISNCDHLCYKREQSYGPVGLGAWGEAELAAYMLSE